MPTQTSSRIVQVMIPTRDLEESVTFYSQVFEQRALAAGATELQPPMDFEWKPRSSYVADPSGNRVQLSQR